MSLDTLAISVPLAPARALPIGVALKISFLVLGFRDMLTALVCMSLLECLITLSFFRTVPLMPPTKVGLKLHKL